MSKRKGKLMKNTKMTGINQDKIPELNRRLLLNLIKEQGVCSRAKLSQISGLNKATITYIVNDFIEAGCVEEIGFLSSEKGRRSIGITLARDNHYVIGIRLARTYYKIGMFDLCGDLVEEIRIEIPKKEESVNVVDNIEAEIRKLMSEYKERQLLAIGMAIPGPFIRSKGKIAVLTEASGFEQIVFKDELRKRFAEQVIVEHDANAGVFAQFWYDREIDKEKSLIYIAAGQGIGAGIMIDGAVIRGEDGIAGEIGHMTIDCNGIRCECGNRGCLEKYCSTLTLRRKASEKKKRECTLTEVTDMIRGGDADIVDIYRESCRYLAYGIVNTVNSYNPAVIIMGDEFSHIQSEIMIEEIDRVLKERIHPEVYRNLTVKISAAVKDSILHGIGALCLDEVFAHYSIYFPK